MSPWSWHYSGAALLLVGACASPLDGRLGTDAAIPADAEVDPGDGGQSVPGCEDLQGGTMSLPFHIETAPTPEGAYPSVALISTPTDLYFHDFSSTHLYRRAAESSWADLGVVTVGQVPTQETSTLGDSSAIFMPDAGAIVVMHESLSSQTRMARYTPATGAWDLLDTELETSHALVFAGDTLFGLQHGGSMPLKRLIMGEPGTAVITEQGSKPSPALLGADPYWMSRVADLANNGSTIYGIKNDWATAPRGDGDRLFQFAAGAYLTDGETSMIDLGPLPFEVGDGAVLTFVPAGWRGQVSSGGGLFVTAGRSPSDQEGFGANASDQYAMYDIACATWRLGALPAASGSGTSAVMFEGALYVKSGGNPVEADDRLWVVP